MTWKKLPPYEGKIHQGCINCPAVEEVAAMEMLIAVGFGVATVTAGAKVIYDEMDVDRGKIPDYWTVQDAEDAALKNPNHSWLITMYAPLRGRTYQRHEPGKWVLVDSNAGFA